MVPLDILPALTREALSSHFSKSSLDDVELDHHTTVWS